jgi:di/tripeptidase
VSPFADFLTKLDAQSDIRGGVYSVWCADPTLTLGAMALFGLKAAAAGAAGAAGADLYKKCTNSRCYIGADDDAAIATIRAYIDEQKAINGQLCRVVTEVEVSVDEIVRFRVAARKLG